MDGDASLQFIRCGHRDERARSGSATALKAVIESKSERTARDTAGVYTRYRAWFVREHRLDGTHREKHRRGDHPARKIATEAEAMKKDQKSSRLNSSHLEIAYA